MRQTPAQANEDPDFALNLTVMRAYDAHRYMKWGLAQQQLAKDELGIGHIITLLHFLYEDQ